MSFNEGSLSLCTGERPINRRDIVEWVVCSLGVKIGLKVIVLKRVIAETAVGRSEWRKMSHGDLETIRGMSTFVWPAYCAVRRQEILTTCVLYVERRKENQMIRVSEILRQRRINFQA